MPAFNKFHQFEEDVHHGVHNFSADQLIVALTNVAPNAATNSVIADITEISYTNLSSRNITTTSSAQTSGTYKLTLTDLVLTASGTVPTFRYVVIVNDTPASPLDPLIAWYDYGSAVDMLTNETFTVDFDDANGFFDSA